jgi:dipeptidyl aminopeptidase/acylaminoacyl peptidase
VELSPLIQSIYSVENRRFLEGALAVQPVADAAATSAPVLVLQGESDVNVSPTLDAQALDDALSSRSGGTQQLVFVPNASHLLKPVGDPDTDQGTAGEIVPDAADALATWLHDTL